MGAIINDLLYRPEWFIPTESVFEIIAMLVTLIISLYSYKVYKLSNNKRYHYLAAGFFGIAAGFFFKTLSNSVLLYPGLFLGLDKTIPFFKISYFYTISLVLYAFLVLSGYVVVACLAANVRNRRTILSLMFIALLASFLIREARSSTFFYFFAFVLLVVYIIPYMYENYKKQKSKSSFLVYTGFLLLTLSNLIFIGRNAYGVYFGVDSYILGQSIGLLGYLVLLLNLVLVLRK